MSAPKRKALGRGLAALIPGAPAPVSSLAVGPAVARARDGAGAGDGTRTIAIEDVHPSTEQPRKTFDGERLEELAASIRTQGIIQPLIVRMRPEGGY
jgi:ParB family chromosome partitioning protein